MKGNARPTTPTGRLTRARVNATIQVHAAQQAGLISYSQLINAGMDAAAIARRVANGSLVLRTERRAPLPSTRTGRRPKQRRASNALVYSTFDGTLGLDARRWSALLAAPQPSWLDHVSALQLLGVEPPGNEPIHVLRRGGGWNAPRGVVAHRTTSIPRHDQVTRHGFPSTALPRATLSAAANVTESRLDDLLDNAVRLTLYDGAAFTRLLRERRNVAGAERLAAAVGRLDATSGRFRSKFERRAKRLVERSARIPQPVVNALVDGYEPDLWWPGTRAIVELDGRDYHRSPAQILRDEEREAILRARGFVFLRLRWHHIVYEEERTLQRIEKFVLANLAPPIAA